MLKQTAQTTRRKRAHQLEVERTVASLRTARAKMMALRFTRTYAGQTFTRLGEDSDKAFRRLWFELRDIGARFKKKLDEKSPGLCLAEFPGPPEVFDLTEAGEFQRRAFEVFSAFDFALVHMESAWLHQAVPYGEHASCITNCEGRIYETLRRVARRCAVQIPVKETGRGVF